MALDLGQQAVRESIDVEYVESCEKVVPAESEQVAFDRLREVAGESGEKYRFA